MYLQRLLQINMAAMAALAAMLLGMGQRDPTVPLLMLVAAILSVWLTDVTGWFQLNRTVASLAMLAAVVVSMANLPSLHSMAQIRFIAQLLVYFQIILLFQRKDSYWALATVSLVQVVVAAAYSQGVWFGVLLVVYLLVALSALALYLLHRERLLYQPNRDSQESPPDATARWPLATRPPAFFGSASPSHSGLGRELVRRLAAMGAATLLLSVLFFFTVPRVGGTDWRGAVAEQRHAVGFSDHVSLGELGKIIEKPDEVMRVRFVERDGNPYPVQGGVYLRGAVLNRYQQGRWRWQAIPSLRGYLQEGVPRWTGGPLVRQQITIEPMDRRELFCVWPVDRTQLGELSYDNNRLRLLRPPNRAWQRFRYELETPAFEDGVQLPLVPDDASMDPRPLMEPNPLLEMPTRNGQSSVPELVALADRWIEESGLAAEDPIGRARFLERRLRDSGQFEYSLEGQPRDLSLDPVEDFITRNPRGHCEYFATALALMLRSQGIPCCVVVGYLCDEWNEVGNFYQVRQWHAHAWVEAYLDPQHIPEDLFRGRQHWEWAAGGWLRLDATPGGPGGPAAGDGSWAARALDWFQSLWNNYVMEMDRSRQREAIYQPLLDWLKAAASKLSDPQWWRESMTALVRGAWQFVLDWIGGDWLSWRGLGALLLFALFLLAAGRGVLLLVRRVLRRLAARRATAARAKRARVEFYRRMEVLLAARGMVRNATQTHHEFALAAGRHLARVNDQPQLATSTVCVAEAFYRVRFGGASLDNRQALEVEQALVQLEQATSRG